ncbi:type II secretion system protein GspG [Candidatus Roizmanbacteria bacterium]|nr:type II secretion system protein GspG [Candidatus Roizmanbacteria bacterium]
MKKSFTLIEILVVATIIVLLTGTAAVTYTAFLKQSRDAKRKADLEQIRASLEMYRSNNNTYPVGSVYSTTLSVLTTPVIYIQSLPADPKNPTYTYYYSGSVSDYTLGSYLEGGGSTCVALQCGGNCNYCLGPYGQK